MRMTAFHGVALPRPFTSRGVAMKNLWRYVALAMTALAAEPAAAQAAAPVAADMARCEKFADFKLDHAKVVSATYDAGGKAVTYNGDEFVRPLTLDFPASCRMTLVISPEPGSRIETEIWLPVAQEWNGKLYSTGNGALAGTLDKAFMAVSLSRGYATSGTDAGHHTSIFEGSWALNNAPAKIDYGYRAIHETAVASKAAIRAFYGKPVDRSYFGSASNGGRAALMEAQRFPEDYDGLQIGTPAFDGTATVFFWSWLEQQFRKPGARILPAKLPAIAAAALSSCDAIDGLRDGLIDDPRRCNVVPEKLLCNGPETDQCLTAPQIASLKAIYEGPGAVDPDGFPYYGYAAGSELNWEPWLIANGESWAVKFVNEFQRYLMTSDPSWTLDRFDHKRDAPAAFAAMRAYQAVDVDLSKFAARGGKIIQYHGWGDEAISPLYSIDYYERVRAKVGPAKAAKFYSLYMVPGLAHSYRGKGPNVFGQLLPPAAGDTPSNNFGAALEHWVEKGIAPSAIVGEEFVGDLKVNFTREGKTASRSRLICPYPQVGRYQGKGSIDDASSFKCVQP
jgi:feruloyl esterase